MLNSSSVSRSHLRRKNSGSCDGWTWVSDVIAQICALFLFLHLESAAVRSNGNFSSPIAKKERKIHYSMRHCEMSFCVPNLSSRVTKVPFSFSSGTGTFQIPWDIANCSYYYFLIIISVTLLLLFANNFAFSYQYSKFLSFALLSRYIWVFNTKKRIKKYFLYLNVFWCVNFNIIQQNRAVILLSLLPLLHEYVCFLQCKAASKRINK